MSALAPWVHALGWMLVHFLWQGLVVGAAFAAVRACLPRTNCRARYAAGLGALALMAAWPVATLVALWPSAGTDADALSLDTIPVAAGIDAIASPWALLDHALPWLVGAWVVGVLAMAGKALGEWRHLTRIARRWATEHAELDTLADALIARFGFVRHVRVLVSEHVDTPMLFGWLKPVVLLPAAVALGFPRHQIELILAHELGHLRRYDHLVNLAQTVLETLLFYHPAVHWISNEVRNERELCCDALVLNLTTGEPREYARTLASLEELRHAAGSLALAANGGELLERVRRIIGMPAPRMASERRTPGRWLLVSFGIGAALIVAQRIERATGQLFQAQPLAVSWLGDYRSRLVPGTSPADERVALPHLRIAQAAPPVVPATSETPTAAIAAVAERVSAPSAAIATTSSAQPVVPSTAQADAVDEPGKPAASIVDATPTAHAAEPVRSPAADTVSIPIQSVASHQKPVAVHTVAPAFPAFARRQGSRVEASFSIAADGSVRDIRFGGHRDEAFEREAERALRQWRFDPATLPADVAGARYQQAFVFAAPSRNSGERDGCIMSTGSRICRDLDSGTMAKVYETGF